MNYKVIAVLVLVGIIGYIQATKSYYGSPHRGHGKVSKYWSGWSSWSRCSKTCGGGYQSRTRTCITKYGYYHGGSHSGCYGDRSESRKCNIKCCPVDGGWSYWGYWSNIHSGSYHSYRLQQRTRSCSKPKPSCNGRYCQGPTKQTRKTYGRY